MFGLSLQKLCDVSFYKNHLDSGQKLSESQLSEHMYTKESSQLEQGKHQVQQKPAKDNNWRGLA